MQTNAEGRTLIESFESCRLSAYVDQHGVWTIGYGHTGPEVVPGLIWTQEQADEAFILDLASAEGEVNRLAVNMTGNEFSACVSLAFNIGNSAFRGSSLARDLRLGDYKVAADEFPKWDHINGVQSDGLLRRRIAEQALFMRDMNQADLFNAPQAAAS